MTNEPLIGISKLHQVPSTKMVQWSSQSFMVRWEKMVLFKASSKFLKMPYVGCNILSSSLAMDKITTKRVLESVGIAQVPYVAIVEGDDVTAKIAEVEEKLTYPVFTKPSNMGSSVGISKSENQEELRQALKLAFQYDSRVLVEQGVNARESRLVSWATTK